jgi:hypothetical protein
VYRDSADLHTSVSNRLSLANPIDLVFAYANMGLKAPVDLELEMAPSATSELGYLYNLNVNELVICMNG